MKILLINNDSRFIKQLKRLVRPAKVVTWNKLGLNIDNFDAVILSGGHKFPVLNHDRTYRQEIKLIRKIHKPLVGICLGSELIAYTFGGKLVRLPQKERGNIIIREAKKNLTVFESHRWAIKKLPENFITLARSKDGIEIFQHKNKPIYGLQFHPEILTGNRDGARILKQILLAIKKAS